MSPGGHPSAGSSHSRRPARDTTNATTPMFEVTDLLNLRWLSQQVTAALADSDIGQERADDFVVAVSEIATNALVHGRPPVDVRLWRTHSRYLCAVTDRGPGFDDSAAGYTPAKEDLSHGGMGLWLARKMSDELTTSVTPAGFTVWLSVHA